MNIKTKRGCSLFQFENPVNAINIIASEATKDDALSEVVSNEISKSPSQGPYTGTADASTNSRVLSKKRGPIDVSLSPQKERSRERQESEMLSGLPGLEQLAFGAPGSSASPGFSSSTPFFEKDIVAEAKKIYDDFRGIVKKIDKPAAEVRETAGEFFKKEIDKLGLGDNEEKGIEVLKDVLTIMTAKLEDNEYGDAEKAVRTIFIDFLKETLP